MTAWWRGLDSRLRIVLPALAVVIALGAGGTTMTGRDGNPGTAAATPPVVVSTVAPTPTSTATSTPFPTPTGTPPATLRTLKELKDFFGEPPQAALGRFRIPSLGVDAPISRRAVGTDLDLQYLNPYGPSDVAWYDFAATPRYGGTPGGGRNAVFAAHVDYSDPLPWAKNTQYHGPGAFRSIDLLAPGDAIEVTMSGRTLTYNVVWKRRVPEHSDWAAIYEGSVPEGDSITLISCSGNFDPITREYDSRTVIRASRS